MRVEVSYNRENHTSTMRLVFLTLSALPSVLAARCNADDCARAVAGTRRGLPFVSSARNDCISFLQTTVTALAVYVLFLLRTKTACPNNKTEPPPSRLLSIRRSLYLLCPRPFHRMHRLVPEAVATSAPVLAVESPVQPSHSHQYGKPPISFDLH